MRQGFFSYKPRRTLSRSVYVIFSALLVLVILTMSLASGLFAKYVGSDKNKDQAQVASSGVAEFAVLEHPVEETYTNSGVYRLLTEEKPIQEGNTYEKVMPGVDIPKDPYVRLKLVDAEVKYSLYIRVTEKDFPTYVYPKDSDPQKAVTYTLEDHWILEDEAKGIYRYRDDLRAAVDFDGEIPIIKDNLLYVSEHYNGFNANGEPLGFQLNFEAYLVQVD